MSAKKCIGTDVFTGAAIEVEFNGAIQSVAPAADAGGLYLAPGWIDIQVNGFAGVDYNDPRAAHEEIARSIRVLYATGVTRFFPTIITGPPDGMENALRNMARAKDTLPEGQAIEGFHV